MSIYPYIRLYTNLSRKVSLGQILILVEMSPDMRGVKRRRHKPAFYQMSIFQFLK